MSYYPYEGDGQPVYKLVDFGENWRINKEKFKIKNACYEHFSFSVIILDIDGKEVTDHGLTLDDGKLFTNIKVKFADTT